MAQNPTGPDAEIRADAALVRLVNEINERRHPPGNAFAIQRAGRAQANHEPLRRDDR